tara:strand:- start:3497 stop:3946 length:450 start_codon:yes stop_codon:yes gene_type:complete
MKPVEVRTLSDIKRVVAEFDPARNPRQSDIPLSTLLEEVENGKRITYRVSTNTRSKSKRDMLIEGLELIQKRQKIADELKSAGEAIEINGRSMKPAVLNSNIDGHSWVDPLISQWTGGIRKGALIVWNIGDGYEYRYEIFDHQLARIKR